jgi:hypothetical protein
MAGHLPLERVDILFHPPGQLHHGLSARGQRVTGAAALEQSRPQLALDLSQASKHRGVIDAERFRRPREGAAAGNGFDESKIIPGQHARRRTLRFCKLN